MSLRDKNLVSGEYYHLYNRGNGKNKIFLDDQDYDRFMKLLYICNSENKFVFRDLIVEKNIDAFDFERGTPLVSILCWTLMPNHFHIIVSSHRSDLWEKGYNPITEFMRKISTSYSLYFNKKYKRSGALFEGKFKSKHIGEENYFNYIFSYVHLNCIKLIQPDWKERGIDDNKRVHMYINNFRYSSFPDFFIDSLKERKESKIIDKDKIPNYLKIKNSYDLFDYIKHP